MRLPTKMKNPKRFFWNLATSSANLASIVSEISEELEAFTSGIEKSLAADEGQHPPAGSFRFTPIRELGAWRVKKTGH